MLIAATRQLGAPRITEQLEAGLASLEGGELDIDEENALLTQLGTAVLNTAKRFGKGRFAQVAARYASLSTELPQYIEDAIDWLNE